MERNTFKYVLSTHEYCPLTKPGFHVFSQVQTLKYTAMNKVETIEVKLV